MAAAALRPRPVLCAGGAALALAGCAPLVGYLCGWSEHIASLPSPPAGEVLITADACWAEHPSARPP